MIERDDYFVPMAFHLPTEMKSKPFWLLTAPLKAYFEHSLQNRLQRWAQMIWFSPVEKSPVPEIDLAFAVSATATDADETFSRIKDTTKYIVKQYGTEQIHYALLAFGSVPSRARDFHRDAISKEDMISFLESVPRSSTG